MSGCAGNGRICTTDFFLQRIMIIDPTIDMSAVLKKAESRGFFEKTTIFHFLYQNPCKIAAVSVLFSRAQRSVDSFYGSIDWANHSTKDGYRDYSKNYYNSDQGLRRLSIIETPGHSEYFDSRVFECPLCGSYSAADKVLERGGITTSEGDLIERCFSGKWFRSVACKFRRCAKCAGMGFRAARRETLRHRNDYDMYRSIYGDPDPIVTMPMIQKAARRKLRRIRRVGALTAGERNFFQMLMGTSELAKIGGN